MRWYGVNVQPNFGLSKLLHEPSYVLNLAKLSHAGGRGHNSSNLVPLMSVRLNSFKALKKERCQNVVNELSVKVKR